MDDKGLYVEEPGYSRGAIADVDVAHELANLEAKKGRNAALTREKELAEGLTEAQKANLAIMEHVKEKYPDACDRLVDNRGHELLRTRYTGNSAREYASPVFLTQEGVVQIQESDDFAARVKDMSANEAWEMVGGVLKGKFGDWMQLGEKQGGRYPLSGRVIDVVGDEIFRGMLSRTLEKGQKVGLEVKKRTEEVAAKSDLKNVLAEL